MYAIDKLNFDEESNFMPHARALTQLVVAFPNGISPQRHWLAQLPAICAPWKAKDFFVLVGDSTIANHV